ncbi:hypothetical protein SAMN02745704_00661 [Paucidesulfovibrio gracilis DSM 16080]|uniref:Uncharacterized protein n=1 Tax=Paucidesulfovibrio gracilis DSM 16080 TaxID=1121449 RepID=A0A1T4WBC6_9BACT|nr:hypothetical protein [Paucidesulfovibrio gracilis]SKA74419.1 hypothetical protein SAMN02745704_00661 [Paucidesulfovibrio gracilis DSM 16080]
MRDDVRCYGDIFGLSEDAFQKLKGGIPFSEVRFAEGKLHLDHEGQYIDVESFLDELAPLLEPDGWGEVDFLDHLGQELIRYRVTPQGWTAKHQDFNSIGTPEMRGMS